MIMRSMDKALGLTSSSLATGAASTFALVAALVGLAPDGRPIAADAASWPLRGSIVPADQAAAFSTLPRSPKGV